MPFQAAPVTVTNGTQFTDTKGAVAHVVVANIERPKGIYNSSTAKFVMWKHKESGSEYNQVRSTFAVSDTVDGDADLHGYELTADNTGYDSLDANPWPGIQREAPALFWCDGVL